MEIYVPRFKNVEERIYTLEVITPMFLGGADKKVAEFRIPSLKGVLRFWWRALYGKKFDSLVKMKEHEDLIFGSTDIKSSFSIEVKDYSDIKIINKKIGINPFDILSYLSYGTNWAKKTKSYISSGSVIKIKIRFFNQILKKNNKIKEFLSYETIENIINDTLFVAANYGGLGFKSRNGFGSFKILEQGPLNDGLKKRIKEDNNSFLLIKDNIPNLNSKMRIFKTKKISESWDEVLRIIGGIYKEVKKKHGLYSKSKEIAKELRSNKLKELKSNRLPKHYFFRIDKEDDNYIGRIVYLYYGPEKIRKIYNSMNEDIVDNYAEELEEIKI